MLSKERLARLREVTEEIVEEAKETRHAEACYVASVLCHLQGAILSGEVDEVSATLRERWQT